MHEVAGEPFGFDQKEKHVSAIPFATPANMNVAFDGLNSGGFLTQTALLFVFSVPQMVFLVLFFSFG